MISNERDNGTYDIKALALEGLLTSGAVTATMAIARRAGFTKMRFADILGTLFGPRSSATRALGWVLFFGNGIALTRFYRHVLDRVPRVHRLRVGVLLGGVHGAVAAIGAAGLLPFHPRAHARGVLGRRKTPRRSTLVALAAAHVVFGAAVGLSARRQRSA